MTVAVKPAFLPDHPLRPAVRSAVDRLRELGPCLGINAFHNGEDQG